MILLSSPLKNDPPETTVSIFFLEIEIVTTKIVNSKSLKKICRQLLSTMNALNPILPRGGSAPPLRFFAHNSKKEKDNSTKFCDFPENI